ncbi:hypothetical protein B6U91_02455 [Candidatus Pacearchaeota archaeon ex4484_71]|nr:MAG: hypothetical protein B6U91_02455 [Candidatus Pacearchaeota archaeon ex4484_71]
MKIMFIPAKEKISFNKKIIDSIEKELPERIAVCYSIQYKSLAKKIKDRLSEKNKEIVSFLQVLGCSKPKFPKETEAILLVGEGRFHSVSLEYESRIPVFILEGNKFHRVEGQDVEKMKKRLKGSYLNYLNSKEIGILVTTKPGQQRLKRAIDFKRNLKDKKGYVFLANGINISEFENFGINSWVNTACPRMDLEDSRIININSLEEMNPKSSLQKKESL